MNASYPKNEKLKSRKLIEKLFSDGDSVTVFPLKLVYIQTEKHNKIGVSVSKNNFKKAVERNRIKRLLREAYRYNKYLLIDKNVKGYAFMILYISKEMPGFEEINKKTRQLFLKFSKTLS